MSFANAAKERHSKRKKIISFGLLSTLRSSFSLTWPPTTLPAVKSQQLSTIITIIENSFFSTSTHSYRQSSHNPHFSSVSPISHHQNHAERRGQRCRRGNSSSDIDQSQIHQKYNHNFFILTKNRNRNKEYLSYSKYPPWAFIPSLILSFSNLFLSLTHHIKTQSIPSHPLTIAITFSPGGRRNSINRKEAIIIINHHQHPKLPLSLSIIIRIRHTACIWFAERFFVQNSYHRFTTYTSTHPPTNHPRHHHHHSHPPCNIPKNHETT